MIEPDRFKLDLDLADGRSPLKLWFCNGAVRRLQIALNSSRDSRLPPLELKLSSIFNDLVDNFNAETLATYIWAARLWEKRDLKVDEIIERLDVAPVSVVDVSNVVLRAIFLGLTGHEMREDKPADPPRPTGNNGTGLSTSASPSVSSDSP